MSIYCNLFIPRSSSKGNEAPQQIIKALEIFNTKFPVDLIIVARGGGSIEDLAAFNDKKLVKAVFKSKIPTISVGHETDFTLTDFVQMVTLHLLMLLKLLCLMSKNCRAILIV